MIIINNINIHIIMIIIMILQFVNYIGDNFKDINGYPPVINIHSRMSLNGRKSQPFFIDTVNVYKNNSDKFLHDFKS